MLSPFGGKLFRNRTMVDLPYLFRTVGPGYLPLNPQMYDWTKVGVELYGARAWLPIRYGNGLA